MLRGCEAFRQLSVSLLVHPCAVVEIREARPQQAFVLTLGVGVSLGLGMTQEEAPGEGAQGQRGPQGTAGGLEAVRVVAVLGRKGMFGHWGGACRCAEVAQTSRMPYVRGRGWLKSKGEVMLLAILVAGPRARRHRDFGALAPAHCGTGTWEADLRRGTEAKQGLWLGRGLGLGWGWGLGGRGSWFVCSSGLRGNVGGAHSGDPCARPGRSVCAYRGCNLLLL